MELSEDDRAHLWLWDNWSNTHRVQHLGEHDPDLVLPAWHDGDGVLDKIHLDYHTHVRNPRKIELTMPNTVTVLLSMTEDDAEVMRTALADARAGKWQHPAEEVAFIEVDDGRNVFRLPASVTRVGSLPEKAEEPKDG